jgi:hypothetical protein
VIYNSIDSSRFVPAQEAQRAIAPAIWFASRCRVFCFVGSGLNERDCQRHTRYRWNIGMADCGWAG